MTPNLAISHIAAGQTQKEVTANSAFDLLDTASTETLSTDVSAGGTITPTAATVTAAFCLKFTGALASSVNFIVPSGKHFYRLQHSGTAHTVTVKVTGLTGVTLQPGDVMLVYCNGTDIVSAETVHGQWVPAPANHTSTGTAGQVAYDGTYLYVCFAANSWGRIAYDSTSF